MVAIPMVTSLSTGSSTPLPVAGSAQMANIPMTGRCPGVPIAGSRLYDLQARPTRGIDGGKRRDTEGGTLAVLLKKNLAGDHTAWSGHDAVAVAVPIRPSRVTPEQRTLASQSVLHIVPRTNILHSLPPTQGRSLYQEN